MCLLRMPFCLTLRIHPDNIPVKSVSEAGIIDKAWCMKSLAHSQRWEGLEPRTLLTEFNLSSLL